MKKNVLYIIFAIQFCICFSQQNYNEWSLIAKIDKKYSDKIVNDLLFLDGLLLNKLLCKELNIWLINVNQDRFNTTLDALSLLNKF